MAKFDAGASMMTRKRLDREEEEHRMLSKTFTAWINHQLKPLGVKISDPCADLSDGVTFIQLLEIMSGKSVEQSLGKKYHKDPSKRVQKIENISFALKFLNDVMNIKLSVDPADFVDVNRKVVITVLWRIIGSRIAVTKQEKELDPKEVDAANRAKQAKANLMSWVQQQTAGYNGVSITDLDSSFQDGLAFCALVHKFDNSLLDFDSLSKENPKDNLTLAFTLAEEKLGIPPFLDVEDMTNPSAKPDERGIMTYLAQFPIAFINLKGEQKADTAFVDKMEEELEAARKKNLELELRFKEEQERALEQRLEKEKEEEELRKAREEIEYEIENIQTEDPKLVKEHYKLVEDNKKIKEELAKLQAENDALQREVISTKQRLLGTLMIAVHEGKKLKQKGLVQHITNALDSFVQLSYGTQQQHQTRTKMKSVNPKWEQQFRFFITEESTPVEITVCSWHLLWKPGFRGRFVIDINDFKPGELTTKWFKLLPAEGKKPSDYGEIKLSILYNLE